MLSPDYSQRGYLLPEGCKDLIDVIKLQQSGKLGAHWQLGQPPCAPPHGGPFHWKSVLPGPPASKLLLGAWLHQKLLKPGQPPIYLPPIKGKTSPADSTTAAELAKLLHKTPFKPAQPAGGLPPIKGEITVADGTTVGELATLLHQKPFRIVADLMEMGVFAGVKHVLNFETITKVARKYGYTAKPPK